jgi:hypothetical protein
MINEPKLPQKRSNQQNRALHKYCTEVAVELNNAGIAHSVFYRDIEADYTMENIKELWRSFARIKYGKTSTAELTTREINEIYDECNRHIAKFGIHIAFPSYQELINYDEHTH